MKQTIAIIHFNTPELTEACILSIRKQGIDWPVVVFDNSREVTWPAGEGMPERTIEAHPFTRRMKGVKVIDNTKGQQVDFEKALQAFPDKHKPHAEVNGWGSDCHMMTVEKLWDRIFGKAGMMLNLPEQTQQMTGIIPNTPVSREAYIVIRDTLLK